MANELATQIRELIDTAPPVTADEAIARSGGGGPVVPATRGPWHGHPRSLAALAATLLLVVAVAGAVALRATDRHVPSPAAAGHRTHPVMLTSARLRQIATSSTAAARSSGTATVTETTAQNGMPQTDESVAVTFEGANIDERITVDPVPPDSAKAFTTDDRLVGGQFYIYTPGPGGVLEWLHDTNSANDVASMQFPDPRSLYGALDASGEFEVLGSTTKDGVTITHLEALDPAAIPTAPLGNLALGSITSFSMWVDSNNVVEQVAVSSAETTSGCLFEPSRNAGKDLKVLKQLELRHHDGTISMPALHGAMRAAGIERRCGPQTTTQNVAVAFSNLGAPESVPMPEGAVDFAGKG